MHKCELGRISYSGFPEVAPQAGIADKLFRRFKMFFVVSDFHYNTRLIFRSSNSLYHERRRHLAVSYWFIIHPYSTISVWIQIFMTITWMVSLIVEPVLDSFYDNQISEHPVMTTITDITTNISRLYILISFIKGYVVYKTSEVILAPKKIMIEYARSYFFIDIFGNLPVQRVYWITGGDKTAWGLCYSILRRLKVLRMITVMQFYRTLTNFFYVDDSTHTKICFTTLTLYFLHWFTCYFYWLPRRHFLLNHGRWHDKSWIVLMRLNQTSNFWIYLNGLHFTISHFMCSGKGQTEIQLLEEMLLAGLFCLVGYFFAMVTMASILQILTSTGASENKYEELLNTLEIYAKKKKLPNYLKFRLFAYYEHKFQKHYFKEAAILETLSVHLNYELVLHSCMLLIKRVPILNGLTKVVIGKILACLTNEVYLPNDVIFDSNSGGHNIYFVGYGCVALSTCEGLELCHYVDTMFFGAISILLEEFKSNLMAIAIEPTQLFILSKADFIRLFHSHQDFADKVKEQVKRQVEFFDRNIQANSTRMRTKFDILYDLKHGKVLERNRKRRF